MLEVGPGLGSLTLGLLGAVRRVVAVEIDPVLAAALPATVAAYAPDHADRFEVVEADALRVTEVPGPPPTALVANLPYNVSVPVLLHLMALLPSLRARPGDGAVRGGRPAGRAARVPHLRRAVGQGGLVRRGTTGRCRGTQRLLAGAQRRLGPRRLGAPRPAAGLGDARAGLRGHRRRVRPAPQDAALHAEDLAGSAEAGRGRAGARRDRPAGARRAARHRGVRRDRRGARRE